jgi:hypothetical protein
VLGVEETAAEVIIRVETSAQLVGCPGCGVVATAHDRMPVEYRDLALFGRPARLVWSKRRWRCQEPRCALRTWTETSGAFSSRCLLTQRAGLECCLQVGLNAPGGPDGPRARRVLGHGDGRRPGAREAPRR